MSKVLLVRTSQMQVYRSVNDCLLKVHLDPASQPKEKESRERKETRAVEKANTLLYARQGPAENLSFLTVPSLPLLILTCYK